jgi:hypothetical protein
LRRSGYIEPWIDRQNGERQRLQKRAAQAAASRTRMGIFGSIFGGGAVGGGGDQPGRLPTLEERKTYMVQGVMRKVSAKRKKRSKARSRKSDATTNSLDVEP